MPPRPPHHFPGSARLSRPLTGLCTLAFTALSAAWMPQVQAEILINEVDADTPGTDALEFVELFNSGAAPVSLANHVLVFFNGSNDQSYLTVDLGSLTIPAGGFLVVGNAGVANVSSVTWAGNLLQNGQDAVALYSGVSSAAGFAVGTPVASPPAGAVLVDAVVYDTGDPDDAGLLEALTPGQPQIDEAAAGPPDTCAIARVPDGGTPLNTSAYAAQAPTPGATNSGVVVPAVLSLTVSPATFVEDGSSGAVTGTVARTGSTDTALTVTLTSANPAEATVPASVEIASGQTQATFAVTAVDDAVSDGDKTFSISAAATGFSTVAQSVTVQDNEPVQPALTVEITESSLTEGQAAGNGMVSRPDTGPLAALTVTLTSSLPDRVQPDPVTLVIPANELFAAFQLQVADDAVFNAGAAATITASATGFMAGTDTVTVVDNDPPPSAGPPTVVINKYLNGSPDMIELLVTGNGTPGSTVDMRGMVIKDFSGSMASDGGKGYRFASVPLFSAVKAGTLIVLSSNAVSPDTTQTDPGDFVLSLGLQDTAWFEAQAGGTFDIAGTEMIMIKVAGADFAGVGGSMHVLAGGAAGTQYSLAPEYKLISSGNSSTGNGVMALTANKMLADYNGTDALGGTAIAVTAFGLPNDIAATGPNTQYIQQLRGVTSVDGSGLARNLVNATPASPYAGANIFPRNATGQTVRFELAGTLENSSLGGFRVTVPAAFGTTLGTGDVAVTGPGAGTPVVSVAGSVFTVTGTAITVADSVTVSIAGRTTPDPMGITDESGYPFMVQTSESGTTFAATGLTPSAAVIVPIATLRDVTATGIPVDLGRTAAFEGVCTEAQFSTNGDTTAFFQDATHGFGIYIATTPLDLQRGRRYAVTGTVAQFQGLAQLNLPSGGTANVVDLGAAAEPPPATVPLATLLADPEPYEGRLIRVTGLVEAPEPGTWGPASVVKLQDSAGNGLDIRIQAGSGAVTGPAAWPADITGILGQYDTSSPYTSGYQLMPREPGDIAAPFVSADYVFWANGYPGIGQPGDDADGDGQPNFLEYALGTHPNDSSSVQEPDLTPIQGFSAFSITKGAAAAADASVEYTVELSTDLTEWSSSGDGIVREETESGIAVRYSGSSPRIFWRLKVEASPAG